MAQPTLFSYSVHYVHIYLSQVVAPLLIAVGEAPLVALPTAQTSFLGSGLVALLVYAHRRAVPWDGVAVIVLPLCGAAMASTMFLKQVPPVIITVVVGLFTIISGCHALYTAIQARSEINRSQDQTQNQEQPELNTHGVSSGLQAVEVPSEDGLDKPVNKVQEADLDDVGKSYGTTRELGLLSGCELVAVGLVAGVGSVLTGTGGPLLLIPLIRLTAYGKALEPVFLVGFVAAAAFSMSLFAFGGNLLAENSIDVYLALLAALAFSLGIPLGSEISKRISQERLNQCIAVGLVVGGGSLLVKAQMDYTIIS